jgi:Ser/Thr protein kinase RdoA (MazF antagonist)
VEWLTKKYKWDFDLCRKMIESYCKVRPMSKEEYVILLAMLVFPHKFWKLGRKRYVKNKSWDEEKYGKKLRRLMRDRKFKSEFIYCYINFYRLDIEFDNDIIEL